MIINLDVSLKIYGPCTHKRSLRYNSKGMKAEKELSIDEFYLTLTAAVYSH